ncbi:MAG TPA: hypothetical protein VF057_08175 [Thermoanaerobaculia bacterium]
MAITTVRDSGFDVATKLLRRRKWIGIAAFAAMLSLALPFAMFLPDVYRGVATIIVENQDGSATFVREPVPPLETRLVTIQQELLSRSRLTTLVQQLNLYSNWRRRPGTTMESIVQRVRRDIHVDVARTDRNDAKTIGLKITYVGLDPRSAAAVPNLLAQMYVSENTRMRERQSGQIAEFLQRQAQAARAEVDRQQARIDAFKARHVGGLPEQISLNMVTLERLNARLQFNADDQLRARERLQWTAASATAAVADPVQTLREKLADLQTRFTDRHPDVIRVRAQISEIEEQRNRSGVTAARQQTAPENRAVVAELASLEREEKILRAEISRYERRIETAPTIEHELEALERDYNTAKDSHASLQKRYEEAQLSARLEQTEHAESFRVLDTAMVPSAPAAPNRLRLLILAGFFAVVAAVGAMLAAEHLDTSFHTVGELRMFTTLPVLATIPYVPARATVMDVVRVAASIAGVIVLCGLLAGAGYRTARENTELVWMLSAPQL